MAKKKGGKGKPMPKNMPMKGMPMKGVAWSTRSDGDPMPYESALLSDAVPTAEQADRLLAMAERHGWNSK